MRLVEYFKVHANKNYNEIIDLFDGKEIDVDRRCQKLISKNQSLKYICY